MTYEGRYRKNEGPMSPIAIFLLFSMLAVLYFDITRFIIPNWLVGGLLLLYPLAVYLSPVPVDWKMALAGMLIVFAVGYFVFAMNWMGGGDIKLITVLSLWVGWEKLLPFVLGFALLGGVLSVSVLVIRKAVPFLVRRNDSLPRLFRHNEPVPYGIAIAAAFLWMMSQGDILLATLS